MYYRDHAPPHFHGFYGDDEALIEIAPERSWLANCRDVLASLSRSGRLSAMRNCRMTGIERSRVCRCCRCLRSIKELSMILRIRAAEVRGPHSLWLSFNDGIEAEVDVLPLLKGPVFEPLRDADFFRRMSLDAVCGTVIWPNGADFAPEALHALVGAKTVPA